MVNLGVDIYPPHLSELKCMIISHYMFPRQVMKLFSHSSHTRIVGRISGLVMSFQWSSQISFCVDMLSSL
jgi:hypothetical protein